MSIARPAPREFLQHGLIAFGINTVIALFLARDGERTFQSQFVYAQCIGLATWALIDFGRFAIRRDPGTGWPTGWRALALPAAGVLAGNLIGSLLGDQLTGLERHRLMDHSLEGLLEHFLYFGLLGGAVAYLFWATGRARHLAEVVAATRRDAAETQLRLLQSQLEPHMLFNTLANLRALVAVDPPRAQAMLDHLIAFLRSTLTASRAIEHPLAAEFERTADYLALMQVRMGARLDTALQLPDDLAAAPVPALLLQPLVENAIRHGLEPHLDGGRLAVAARRDGDDLVIEVRDTGVGLGAATGGAGPGAAADAAGTGFGLEQVRRRLATRYGARAPQSPPAAPDGAGATLATVRLPIERTA